MVIFNFTFNIGIKGLVSGVAYRLIDRFLRRISSTLSLGALSVLFIVLPVMNWAQTADTKNLLPWLDIPANWSRIAKDNVITLVPNDLPAGAVLLFMIEPPAPHKQSLEFAYEKALHDLGPWKPVEKVLEQTGNNNWRFRFGIGVTQLKGVSYTALTAVALRPDLLIRFWVLAESDTTYNHYQAILLQAISSVQDIRKVSDIASTTPSETKTTHLDPAFGKGLSGVYVGILRGLRASAAVQTYIDDYQEIDVFYPDHTYRRRLPIRGLNGDLTWERQQQLPLWGNWQQQGNVVIVRRGNYQIRYTLHDQQLVDERGRTWHKVKLSSENRIDGVYARADFREADAPRLVLRADGRYEDRGEFLRMVSSAGNLVEPDGNTMVSHLSQSDYNKLRRSSVGTYRYENFSLTLYAQDGRIWQINAFVSPTENFPMVRQMVVNGYKLQRD